MEIIKSTANMDNNGWQSSHYPKLKFMHPRCSPPVGGSLGARRDSFLANPENRDCPDAASGNRTSCAKREILYIPGSTGNT